MVYTCWPDITSDNNGPSFDAHKNTQFAVIKIRGTIISAGSPNDEAQFNHPIGRMRLRNGEYPGPIVEVLHSPWAKEIQINTHKLRKPIGPPPRHLVFLLKENTIDVIAKEIMHIGNYLTMEEARDAALEVAPISY